MATWNGLVCGKTLDGSTLSQLQGSTQVSYVSAGAAVPAKFFSHGQFGIQLLNGVSGVFGVQIVGSVGGATYVIAGRTNISAVGGFPVPLIAYVGTSGAPVNYGIPRPAYVAFGGVGNTTTIGFTANVFFAGRY
jgi:hypothetical protein